MKGKKLLALLLGVTLLMSPVQYAQAEGETEVPVNQEEHASGYIESDLDQNTPVYMPMARAAAAIPSAFPSDIEAMKEKYPDNRDQNPYGTCWAFASMGLAEFDLINDGAADRNVDFSELQLAYFAYNFVQDPLGGTEGDSAQYYNENTDTNYLNRGGNFEYASRRLSQWIGAVDESNVPYDKAADTLTRGVPEEYAYGYNKAHLENAYDINIKANPDDVKTQIMQHGAVGAMYYHNDANMNYKAGTYPAYYDPAKTGGGHAIMIVGWNDDYSKDNFIGETKPQSNGAWLIRNSWGFQCSYFWMSYENASLMDAAWVFDFNANDGYDNNYQLDGGIETYKCSKEKVANVFTVQQKHGVESELLKAVSLSMTHETGVGYTIEIYTDLQDVADPTSGTKQETATTSGTTTYAGIYTILLQNSVRLTPGTTFSVVVTCDQSAIDQEQATSMANGDKMVWEKKVSKYNNKSFYYAYNRYNAEPGGNYCIKAFTSNNAMNDAEMVADAKKAVTDSLNDIIGSNSLTREEIQGKISDSLTKAGITDVTITVGEWNKVDATIDAEGNITATITIQYGTAVDTVQLNKVIAQLALPESSSINVVYGKTQVGENLSDADLTVDNKKLIENLNAYVFTTEEKNWIANGASVQIYSNINNITDSVGETDQKLINAIRKKDQKIGLYLDISVGMRMLDNSGNEIAGSNRLIHESHTEFTGVIALPDELVSKDATKTRTYEVIRIHDGKAEVIPSDFHVDTKTISFTTDKFSTYAVAYLDTDKSGSSGGSGTGESIEPGSGTGTNHNSDMNADENTPQNSGENSKNNLENNSQNKAENNAGKDAQDTSKVKSPDTMDNNVLVFWLIATALIGAGMFFIESKERKKENKEA